MLPGDPCPLDAVIAIGQADSFPWGKARGQRLVRLLGDLVTLSGSQLTSIEIDLSILCEEADHLMICGRDNIHDV